MRLIFSHSFEDLIHLSYVLFTLKIFTTGPNHKTGCLALCSVMIGTYMVSFFSLIAVSVDRYFAICHTFNYRKTAGEVTTALVIFFCWSSSLIGFLPLFGWNNRELSSEGGLLENCHPFVVLDRNYIIFMCVCVFFIPTILLLTIYALIYKKIKNQVSKPKGNKKRFLIKFSIS